MEFVTFEDLESGNPIFFNPNQVAVVEKYGKAENATLIWCGGEGFAVRGQVPSVIIRLEKATRPKGVGIPQLPVQRF